MSHGWHEHRRSHPGDRYPYILRARASHHRINVINTCIYSESHKVDITGFMYESWHYRYVGVKVATDMHDNYPDLSYEEYYYKFIDNK